MLGLGRGFSRWKILFGGFLALLLMIFGTVLVPSGETWAYENTCRAFRIGTDAGYKYETVCVNVNGDGNADSIETKYGTLYMSQISGGGYTYPRLCLINTSSAASDSCRTFNFSTQKDPVSILNQIEELLKKSGKEYNGSTLNGDVEGQTVADINEDYTNDEEINSALASEEDTSDDTTSTDSDVDCTSSGAAKSLGWVVCPVLDLMGDASETIYNDLLKPNLQVEPELFTNNSGKGTKDAWEIFRNIANGLLIILFLVVIFSQLTGVGIDNYGIKKILPKLIVAAILMNLSYWICVALVDVSNILGNSLQALFNGLGDGLVINSSLGDGFNNKFAASGTTLVSLVVVGAVMGVLGRAVAWNPAIILALIVSILGILISVFFLFILLAVRQAAIVILIVLSPLAIACMMIPNTKSLFDKWLKLFEGLLLVYPIAGLLIGGGNYVSKLLLATGFGDNGIFSAITSMVIGITPIFFIPTVLKQSFAAMGNLGAKISGLGQRASGWSQSKMRNSAIYKNAQERGLERQTRLMGGIDKNGNPVAGKRRTFAKLMSGGERNMARYRAQYLKDQDARNREGNMMGNGYEAALLAQREKAEADEVANYMAQINAATRNGEDEAELYRKYDEYVSMGNKTGAVAVARIAGRRKDTAKRFMKQKITDSAAAKAAGSEMFSSILKEVATGENNAQYRTSSPLGFEFAAQVNSGRTDIQDYSQWEQKSSNVDSAVQNYVTNGQELVGMSGEAQKELADLMNSGRMSPAEVERLRQLAGEVIDNRNTTGVWDSTKKEGIYRIAGRNSSGLLIPGSSSGDFNVPH